MKATEVSHPGGPLQAVERELPAPGAGEVLVKVQACGICHSDFFTKEGALRALNCPTEPSC